MVNDKHFVIAHLSDLHLTSSDDKSRSRPRMFGSIKGMNEAFRKIIKSEPVTQANLIIVTGDVTDRGDIESWKIFWKEIKEAGLSEKVLVVPGNHDVCCLRARLPFKKKKHCRKDLKKTSSALQIGNQETEFPWARKFDGHVAIFGLNSNNAGNISILSNAIGRIGYYQLLSFAQKLYTHRNVPVKIIVLHHSPKIPHKSPSRKRGGKIVNRLLFIGRQIPVRQQRALLMLCLSHGVKLIAHGHVHKAHEHLVNGIHIVGAPPTTQPIHTTSNRNLYQFFIYTIEKEDGRINTKLRTIKI
jgi:3',5'-cyclic AMP phosphodiesterase CpdA